MKKFQSKKQYIAQHFGNGPCYAIDILKRTEKTVTIKVGKREVKLCKIYLSSDEEYIFPVGKYLIAPVCCASSPA